eukprot:2117452-Rhodomonas_salina.1
MPVAAASMLKVVSFGTGTGWFGCGGNVMMRGTCALLLNVVCIGDGLLAGEGSKGAAGDMLGGSGYSAMSAGAGGGGGGGFGVFGGGGGGVGETGSGFVLGSRMWETGLCDCWLDMP